MQVVGHYHGPGCEFVVSILYNISLQSTNIASMIVSAQILDVFIVYTCTSRHDIRLVCSSYVCTQRAAAVHCTLSSA